MRIAVLTGIVACTLIFGISSEKTSALPLDKLDNISDLTSVDTLLAAAEPKLEKQQEKETKLEQPVEVKHVVAENESLSDIAKEHDVSWKKIFDKNTVVENPDVINPGEVLVIPAKEEVIAPRELPIVEIVTPAPAKKVTEPSASRTVAAKSNTQAQVSRGSSSGNRYAPGNCTWYAKSMRPDMPNNLGNARTWVSRAASQGFATGSTPRVGAIAQRNNHVAYVTGVNGDGTINISDMNYRSLYAVTYRTVPANQWLYIY